MTAAIYKIVNDQFDKELMNVLKKKRDLFLSSPIEFHEDFMMFVVKKYCRHPDGRSIRSDISLTENELETILDKKTLFDAFISHFLLSLEDALRFQLEEKPTDLTDSEIKHRRNFLEGLKNILKGDNNNPWQESYSSQPLEFKLKKIEKLAEHLANTNIEPFKDKKTLGIFEIIYNLLTLSLIGILSGFRFRSPLVQQHTYGLLSFKTPQTLGIERTKALIDKLDAIKRVLENDDTPQASISSI